jgi:hypothetical protein
MNGARRVADSPHAPAYTDLLDVQARLNNHPRSKGRLGSLNHSLHDPG